MNPQEKKPETYENPGIRNKEETLARYREAVPNITPNVKQAYGSIISFILTAEKAINFDSNIPRKVALPCSQGVDIDALVTVLSDVFTDELLGVAVSKKNYGVEGAEDYRLRVEWKEGVYDSLDQAPVPRDQVFMASLEEGRQNQYDSLAKKV